MLLYHITLYYSILQQPVGPIATINVALWKRTEFTTTPHNKKMPDCFTPPNAEVEHGFANTDRLLSLR